MPRNETAGQHRERRKAVAAGAIPANVRRPIAAMDSRDRPNSTATRGLLGRQLASITNTLAKASQRRDAELQRRTASKPSVAPVPQIPPAPSPTDASLTLATGTGSVSDGDSVVFGGRQTKPNLQNFGRFDLDLPEANAIMGWIHAMPPKVHGPMTDKLTDENTLQGFLHEGYVSDDEDPTYMLAGLEPINPAARTYDVDPKEIWAHFGKSESIVSIQDVEEDPKTMRSHILPTASPLSTQGENVDDIEPAQLLAGFDNTSSEGPSTVRGENEDVDPEQLLTALERSLSFGIEAQVEAPVSMLAGSDSNFRGHSLATDPEWEARFDKLLENPRTSPSQTQQSVLSDDEDPQSMLAELERGSSVADDTDPRRMLAELKRGMLQEGLDEDDDDSLEALRVKLTGTLSLSSSHVSPAPESTSAHTTSSVTCNKVEDVVALDKNLTPYVIALQLEISGLPWEEVQGWTTYLFSSGLDGYKACQEKDTIVKRATDELDEIIHQVMEEERYYLSIENKARLPRRLIVSNIAAGAGVEDLREFFSSFRFVVQRLKLLPVRDPVKRTKVAHIDMVTRKYAVRASYMTGSIFGLLLDIKLAVEEKT